MKPIVILGGGFGGLYTALALAKLPWKTIPQIILIDRNDRFLFTPLLYEKITEELETWEIAPKFTELLANTPIQFKLGEVTHLDIPAKTIQIISQGTITQLEYEYAVIAMGATTPGVPVHAIPFRTLVDSERLESKLATLEQSDREKIRIVIAGGGTSGVELACKLADRLGERGRIRIVDRNPQILSRSSINNQKAAAKALQDRSVWIDLLTKVVEVTETTVTLETQGQQESLPSDLVLWTVGTSIPDWLQKLPLAYSDPSNKILVTSALNSPSYPEVFALGDIAHCRDGLGVIVPGTAQSAFQQSQYCAWNLWALTHHKPLVNFTYIPLGEMVTLGKGNGVANLFDRVAITGRAGSLTRKLIYFLRMPTIEHQMRIAIHRLSTISL